MLVGEVGALTLTFSQARRKRPATVRAYSEGERRLPGQATPRRSILNREDGHLRTMGVAVCAYGVRSSWWLWCLPEWGSPGPDAAQTPAKDVRPTTRLRHAAHGNIIFASHSYWIWEWEL